MSLSCDWVIGNGRCEAAGMGGGTMFRGLVWIQGG